MNREPHGRLRLSRGGALALIAVAAAATYYLAIIGAATLLRARGGASAAVILFVLPLVSAVAAAALLPAKRTQSWLRVMLAKHLFSHRYDYRTEWMRFTETLARPGETPAPLEVRVVKAIADIVDSPAGLLLLPEEGELAFKAAWQWDDAARGPAPRLAALLATGWIIALDPLRAEASPEEASAVPEWMLAAPAAWAIVPLIHGERLAGAVLLERPHAGRQLDWEDFDVLRIAGRQVASYLAEAQGQDALSEARRFEEFNRRFAFIMHDIKNLVSQLSLVARNAERHADNPAFRADMIATLNNSTSRMNDLLARLSQHNKARTEEPHTIAVGTVVDAVAAAKRGIHPIVVVGDAGQLARADPARLETALAHLVQNAIEASPASEPVTIAIATHDKDILIEIVDRGCGMTADFVHGQLFRPFASTKEGGFGIGAYEARSLIAAMGGRLSVKSAPDAGTRFIIALPGATHWIGERAA